MGVIGDRTKQRREDLRLSQPELARLVNSIAGRKVCTQQSIQQVESGITQMPRYVIDLAKALGVSLEWLRGDDAAENAGEDEAERHALALLSILEARMGGAIPPEIKAGLATDIVDLAAKFSQRHARK